MYRDTAETAPKPKLSIRFRVSQQMQPDLVWPCSYLCFRDLQFTVGGQTFFGTNKAKPLPSTRTAFIGRQAVKDGEGMLN